jgi:aminoglycoside 3'-phosphotransferase-2
MTPPANLPELFAPLRERPWTAMTIGKSEADVWRIDLGESTSVFLKRSTGHASAELSREAERLIWLTKMGFKAPRVVESLNEDTGFWLLMTAVPGQDLTHIQQDGSAVAKAMAHGLRRLHALDPRHCPFDQSIDAHIAIAEANIIAGRVDEDDFDDAHQGWSAAEVLGWVKANRPETGEPLVTHGDLCLPNIFAEDGRFCGMVDLGRLGRADVWQDIAIAARSLRDNCGADHIPTLINAYGIEWDEAKFRFYCALDELF